MMDSVFETYFTRFEAFEQRLTNAVDPNLNIIVTIPCYNEPDFPKTMESLAKCQKPHCSVEVIVVVNHSDTTKQEIISLNKETYQQIQKFEKANEQNWIHFCPILAENLPAKKAGVGLARKIAMDEAIRRFATINNPNGIIISCDADVAVESTYFIEIERFYSEHPKTNAANCYFEHPLSGNLSEHQYSAIAQYELYMRYYVEQLKRIGFPYAHHTIGSCFTVRAKAYCKQGGMNKRQAGEDFYFLQKLFQAETFGEIITTTIYPSSRTSDRVPFGTGTVISKMTENQTNYSTFSAEAFDILKDFFSQILQFWEKDTSEQFYKLHPYLQEFLQEDFVDKIEEIKGNVATIELFKKRFFNWFNGFMVYKFLNFVHQEKINRVPIIIAAKNLISVSENDVFELLKIYRLMARNLQ